MPSLQFLNDTEVEREELSGAEEEEEERELEMEGEADEEEHEEEQEMGEDIESHEIHPQNHHELHHEQEDDELENQEDEIMNQGHPEMGMMPEGEEEEEGEEYPENENYAEEEEEAVSGEMEELDIKSDDLEAIAVLYDQIRGIRRSVDQSLDQTLAEDFDKHLKVVMFELSDQLKTDQPTHIKNANILKAKMSLYEICFTKAKEFLKETNEEVGTVFEKIEEGHNQIFGEFVNLVASCSVPEGESTHLRQKLQANEKETQEVIAAANNLNSQFENEMNEKERMKVEYEREIAQLRKQLNSNEIENKRLLDTLIRHSKGEDLTRVGHQENYAPGSAGAIFKGTQNRKYNKLTGPVGKTQTRTLTLKQLKDIINDIYNSKVKYDQKCEESKLPRETMEQFMYTYLNQRYGLKNLIIEWVAAIINGIKNYLKEDHDVALFGKILKNECDEEFRYIQMHVKDTLIGLLKTLLKERFPLKSESEINRMMKQIQSGVLEEWQWRSIIEKMYDPNDYEILEQKFIQVIQDKKTKNYYDAFSDNKKLTREEQLIRKQQRDYEKLPFEDFQKIILDFQLKEHEKFLEKFIVIFKSIDTDNNGVINEDEFRDLISSMDVIQNEEEVNYLLQVIDPYNNQQMTFSELVHLFSSVSSYYSYISTWFHQI